MASGTTKRIILFKEIVGKLWKSASVVIIYWIDGSSERNNLNYSIYAK